MLQRLSEHYVGIKTGSEKKYCIIQEIKKKGHDVTFSVLYYAKETKRNAIDEEIGAKEGEYIRKYRPLLNTQIPKEDSWRKYDR